MRVRLFGREKETPVWRVVALALVLVGLAFAVLAADAQNDIDEIGDTNDEILQNRSLSLQNERNAYIVCAIGFVFLGLFGFFTLVEPGYSRKVAAEQMISGARTNQSMLRGLSLLGNASYLPASHGLTVQRVFVQAVDGDAEPPSALSDDMSVAPGKDGSSPGMLIDPPGLRLLEMAEEDYDAVFVGAGVEAAEGSLQVLKHGLGMLRDFHFKEREGKTMLRVEYADLLPACRIVRRDMPDTCRQVACIGCSCLLLAVAKATNKIARVESVDNSEDTVVFTIQLRDW
ncbi:MAG: hypothetical protein JSV94_04325 [Methanobacteriota archaeon]|nr:MAG: hypothetical protein JSV94_04325 [Euryarchaeota archaeon]